MRLSSLFFLFTALSVGCGGADGGGNGDDDEKVVHTCLLGITSTTSGEFTPMTMDNDAELVLGFQGFLFVVVHVQTDAPGGGRVDVKSRVTVETDEPFGAVQKAVPVKPGDPMSITDDVQVFLDSSNISTYEDRTAEIALRLDGDGWYCTATASIHFVNEDPCIHTGDKPICP